MVLASHCPADATMRSPDAARSRQPSFLARRDALAGRIEPVLTDWALPELCVFAGSSAAIMLSTRPGVSKKQHQAATSLTH
jgi:hypothetical protein